MLDKVAFVGRSSSFALSVWDISPGMLTSAVGNSTDVCIRMLEDVLFPNPIVILCFSGLTPNIKSNRFQSPLPLKNASLCPVLGAGTNPCVPDAESVAPLKSL